MNDGTATRGDFNSGRGNLMGSSGMGKTTLLGEHLIRSDVAAGRTVVVIDPHADLAQSAAAVLHEATGDVLVHNFGSVDPPPWALTAPEAGIGPHEWADALTSVLREMWADLPDECMGPVFLRAIRAALRVLVEDPEGPWPLTRLPDVLDTRNPLFRAEALQRIGDLQLARLVEGEVMPMLTGRDAGNAMLYLTGKLDPIIGDQAFSRVVDTGESVVSISPVLEGRSLVASFAASSLNPATARALAGILVSQLWLLVRARGPADATPIAVYVDEWQQVMAPCLAQMLQEGRKFGLHLRLANQNASQLRPDLLDAALANCGGIAMFRAGVKDAMLIHGAYSTVTPHELATLPDHWVALTSGGADMIAPAPGPTEASRSRLDALEALHGRTQKSLRTLLLTRLATAMSGHVRDRIKRSVEFA